MRSDDPLLDLTPAPPMRPSEMQSTDDLLNSLDLGGSDNSSTDLDLGSSMDDVEETIEELEVLPDDSPEVAPPPPDRPGRTTLVKDEEESAEMRRRIGRPAATAEAVLDELSADDELSLDAPAPAAARGSFTGLDAGGARRKAPEAAPAATSAPAPVSIPVEITAARGDRQLTVPIEVTVGKPGTPTHVRLHIALTIKLI